MPQTLILTEKPSVAKRIAEAIGKPKALRNNNVTYYEVDDSLIAPSVGHVYTLTEKKKNLWNYPIFDINWAPSYLVSKNSDYTRKYLENLEELAESCDNFINACDYDLEGEVIAFNILKYACKVDPLSEKVKRMKFSSLTQDSIDQAYKNLENPQRGMVDAGLARHVLDWYWGINLSRALTLAIRRARGYVTLSIGRVQGPALKILSIRDREIKNFKPQTYWELELIAQRDQEILSALHQEGKFWEKEKVDEVKSTCGDTALVKKVERKKYKQLPPYPFDLTTLQTEAYRTHRVSPSQTLRIAQDLYTNALISYPRTSSQKLPPGLNYLDIMEKLKKLKKYGDGLNELLQKKKLLPHNGRKKDPAHPAIYPTGEIPGQLEKYHQKIYDLIVRRFMATFGDPAIRESQKIELDNHQEIFIAKGNITLKPGWHKLYGEYAKFKEIELPTLKEGGPLKVKDLKVHEKETQPPKRYTPASIIKELEKKNLGTKATRSQILDTLFKRNYLRGKSIEVTPLGLGVVDTLEKYCPEVLSEKLTRQFEEKMQLIESGKASQEKIVKKGQATIEKISQTFKAKEQEIGEELKKSLGERESQKLGKCLECSGNLVVRQSRYGKFIGCDSYPQCKFTLPLPKGHLKVEEEKCKECGYAKITVLGKNWTFCVNPECPTRKKKVKEQATS